MSPATIFFGLIALGALALMASIASSCSALADMVHDDQERRRTGAEVPHV